ncbi:MAG TPA: class I SAM-dependent DNA methyltransferase [Candidatus Competibacter sp.]|nr:class I SAM-dependent DNA methyltransferase [Candidatus Competibacter sp.]
MTPREFIGKWRAADLKERSAAQEHFIDLCRLLDEPTPAEADPAGEWYCFERGASKLSGGRGWADVWKRGYFGWEYKGKRHDLKAAYVQLQQYAVALENPPLLVVCDLEQFWIYTHWTNTVQRVYQIALDDLHDANKRQMLKWVFTDPEQLKPGITRQSLTEEAAQRFADLAQRLRANGHEAQAVAHFINRLVFCMFAEDVGLLPNQMFTRMLRYAHTHPDESEEMARDLFRGMRSGGRIGFEDVEWFNGGLFDSDEALPLDGPAILEILKAARLDWSEIDPSIFGTLFERGLDPDKRSQLGAHYTDRDKIMLLVEPVIIRPLQAEWEGVRAPIAAQLDKARTSKSPAATKARKAAQTLYNGFLERLRQVRILDPACGSGNFLYLGLQALKDFEHRVNVDAEALGLDRQFPTVGPECVQGIEINLFAAELARTTVWIGEIQWMRRNGFDVSRRPILRPLDTVECRDALLNPDGSEAAWPDAEFIVGNPPFLGDKKQLAELGEDYVATLRQTYAGRVPGGADLVCYWFEKARAQIEADQAQRAGLVATNSIRGGVNRKVLERILNSTILFEAWSDEPWINEGAAVRVSLVGFGRKASGMMLDGQPVVKIHANLTGRGDGGIDSTDMDLTQARQLAENANICFQGCKFVGSFEVTTEQAYAWLRLPLNPNGCPNSNVLRRWSTGIDLSRRPEDRWVIDFGLDISEADAALYEAPFEHILKSVKPARALVRREGHRKYWWRYGEPRPEMRYNLAKLNRFIATPEVAKHRVFVWLDARMLTTGSVYAIVRDDDTTFGVLHSRFHELWALRLCTWLGVGNDPRYTPTTTFETFPFPEGLTPNIPASDYAPDPRAQAIAQAARRLNELRENWLNPPEWVRYEPEVVPGYPDRLVPVDDKAAALLKKRTLTNLYNERPAWLANVHRDLDAAVAAAYGWPADLGDDEILRRLLALNLERT